jgi:arginase
VSGGVFTYLGVPVDSVGRSGGTELGPAALRALGLVDVLGGADAGDTGTPIRGEERDPGTGLIASEGVLGASTEIRMAVRELLERGERPFLGGGCCTEVVGALAGARDVHGRVGLAYLDGHVDLYDGRTSPTGEAADMPISVVLGLGPDAWVGAMDGASVAADDVAIIGYRDLDESLADGMRDPNDVPGLRHSSNDALRAEGPNELGQRVAADLADGPGRFWLHLDVDVLDQDVFPATDYLMPGGLSWDELVQLMGPLARSDALIGASIGCYNPEKDPDESCGRSLVSGWRLALAAG